MYIKNSIKSFLRGRLISRGCLAVVISAVHNSGLVPPNLLQTLEKPPCCWLGCDRQVSADNWLGYTSDCSQNWLWICKLHTMFQDTTKYIYHTWITQRNLNEKRCKFRLPFIKHDGYTAYNISCYDNEHVLPWWGWSWLWWWLWDNPGPQTPGPATGREQRRRSLETSWWRQEWSRMGIFRFQRWVFIVTTPGTPRGKEFRVSIK